MPLRVPLQGQPTLAQLRRDLEAVAKDRYHDNELRSDGRSLYIKLRSACCAWRRESARHDHRRRAVALVRERFAAALDELGAGFMKDRLLAQLMPEAGGRRPAPVRVQDVLALEELVAHARRLATRLSGPLAVMMAVSSARKSAGRGEDVPVEATLPGGRTTPISRCVATTSRPGSASVSVSTSALQPAFEQRACNLLTEAERIAAGHARSEGSPGSRRCLPEGFLSLSASFAIGELVTAAEQRRIDHFMRQAGPLLDKVTPQWTTMLPQQQLETVEQLVRLHQASYGYGAVEVHFDGALHGAARLSANGIHVTLPVARADVTRNFDEFVHLLAYGLTLRHQHQLAARLPTSPDADMALARIMRACQLVPMDKKGLVDAFGMRLPAAREAWLSGAVHRHATAMADIISARAYAALPNDESRLPAMARARSSH